jgi:hypothetical protein
VVRETVRSNPELFLPVFLLFVWQITAIAVKPQTLGLAVLMTLLLLVYGYRVLGKDALASSFRLGVPASRVLAL